MFISVLFLKVSYIPCCKNMNAPWGKKLCRLLGSAARFRVAVAHPNISSSNLCTEVLGAADLRNPALFRIVLPASAKRLNYTDRFTKNINCLLLAAAFVFTLHARKTLQKLDACASLMGASKATATEMHQTPLEQSTGLLNFNPSAHHSIFWFQLTLKSSAESARIQGCDDCNLGVPAFVTSKFHCTHNKWHHHAEELALVKHLKPGRCTTAWARSRQSLSPVAAQLS